MQGQTRFWRCLQSGSHGWTACDAPGEATVDPDHSRTIAGCSAAVGFRSIWLSPPEMVRRRLPTGSARDVPECKSTQGLKRGYSKPSGPVICASRQSDGIRIDAWRDGDKNGSLLRVKQGESSFSPAPRCNNRECHIGAVGSHQRMSPPVH